MHKYHLVEEQFGCYDIHGRRGGAPRSHRSHTIHKSSTFEYFPRIDPFFKKVIKFWCHVKISLFICIVMSWKTFLIFAFAGAIKNERDVEERKIERKKKDSEFLKEKRKILEWRKKGRKVWRCREEDRRLSISRHWRSLKQMKIFPFPSSNVCQPS